MIMFFFFSWQNVSLFPTLFMQQMTDTFCVERNRAFSKNFFSSLLLRIENSLNLFWFEHKFFTDF